MTDGAITPAEPRQRGLREWLYRTLPRPRPCGRLADAEREGPRTARILIFTKGRNPTFDYYLESRLDGDDRIPFVVCDIDRDTDLDEIEPRGVFIVVCRYLRRRQVAWMASNRKHFSGVALFVDDDIAAVVADPGGSLAYKLYVAGFGLWPLWRMNRNLSQVWVSTEALRQRFESFGISARLLSPRPRLSEHRPTARSQTAPLRIAYHATDVHGREHRFLVPIIERVLARHPHVVIEVLARGRNRHRWLRAAIAPSQLHMLPLRSWPEYHAESRSRGADIFLVPLLESRVNAARADTKRIDACRLGAAAIFSSGPIYERMREQGEVHVGNSADEWVAAIDMLITDRDRRLLVTGAVARSVARMTGSPPSDLRGFCLPRFDEEVPA